MAAVATTDIPNVLRYTYAQAEKILYLFNQEVPLWNVLSKTKKELGGRGQFLMPILKTNPGTWSGIAQGGAIPTAVNPSSTEASYALQEFVGIYSLSWKLIQDARNSKFAFQQSLQMMDEGLKRRVFRCINADFLADGRGQLAALGAASNADPFTVRYLPRAEVGMVVDLMASSDDDTKLLTGRTITAIDPIARTITTGSAPAGTAANDYVVIKDTTDISVTTTALHTNGILGLISNANPTSSAVVNNVGGINRSTTGNDFWKSPVLSNSGVNRPFTEDLGLQAEDAVREKGGAKISHWFSNLAIARRYHEVLRAESYFALGRVGPMSGGLGRNGGDGSEGAGPDGDGQTPYEFSGTPWHVDPFFEANTIIGFDRSHFFAGTGENETPMPISEIFKDQPFFRQTSNATYDVVWYWQGQLLTDNPAAGVRISDVAES